MRSPPGRCGHAAVLLALSALVFWLLGITFGASAHADKPERSEGTKPAGQTGSSNKPGARPAQNQKSRSYTFSGLDIEGKLKTPQILYFLNRMRSEFDSTVPDRRSFLPEIDRSTDEM